MKFLNTSGKVFTVKSNQETTQECYTESLKITKGNKVVKPKVHQLPWTSLVKNQEEAELDLREA